MEELVAEIATMKIFDHPNVLKLLGVCVDTNDDGMLRAVLPYMANGDLRNFLKQKRVDPTNTTEYAKVLTYIIKLSLYLKYARYVAIYIHTYVHRNFDYSIGQKIINFL